jgi:hypothetical protein
VCIYILHQKRPTLVSKETYTSVYIYTAAWLGMRVVQCSFV